MTAGSISVPVIIPLRPPILGQPKSFIDTNTRIEMKSDTPNVRIFYTTNGLKPEPFESFSPEAKSTLLYKEPIVLEAGKKTIKALAVSDDNRQSYIVTKVFDVEFVPTQTETNDNEDNLTFMNEVTSNNEAKHKAKKFVQNLVNGRQAWMDAGNIKSARQVQFNKTLPNKFISHERSRTPDDAFMRKLGLNGFKPPQQLITDSNQFVRLQRETDYLKCSYCLAPRPTSDPFARFCNECGHPVTPLMQNKLPPPQVNQVGRCFTCQSVVPFNMTSCLVCESPLKQQCLPRPEVKLTSMVPCVVCGTANQPNLRYCVTCNATLPDSNLPASLNISPMRTHNNNNNYLAKTCSKCGRVNNSKARFCDWCQSKIYDLPGDVNFVPIPCNKCGTTNQAHAHYCANCGNLLQFPDNNVAGNLNNGMILLNSSPAIQTSEVGTQTVGLFYPSVPKFKHMNLLEGLLNSKQQLNNSNTKEGEWVDQKPILASAISPGRGYWRKQIEHMCAHLKAHASRDTNFRSLIAHPRMGKLLQATVNEDGYELSLTLNFALRSSENIVNTNNLKNNNSMVNNRSMNKLNEGELMTLDDLIMDDDDDDDVDDYDGDDITRSNTLKGSSRKQMNRFKNTNNSSNNNNNSNRPFNSNNNNNGNNNDSNNNNNTTSELNKSLMKEVGKFGRGRVQKVQELILEGASPSECTTREGHTLLHQAAIFKHYDVIPSLVEAGLQVDAMENSMHNTALHEAVRHQNVGNVGNVDEGVVAMKVVEALLGCGANPLQKNKLGETPYELATRVGRQDLANKMSIYIGQNNINKLAKPKKIKSDF